MLALAKYAIISDVDGISITGVPNFVLVNEVKR
ncbi:MAG: hypothetical protein AB200_01845 [Parcubacteria bacterium C7867-005]|nr:MAG: hypothetical protein AB200_01845 [Parcubacteria bacterium C7867-005]